MEREIQTGIEHTTDVVDALPENVTPDVYAYADDGEHAIVWAIARIEDTTVEVDIIHCKEELADHIKSKVCKIDAEMSTEEWARLYANNHRKVGVEIAKLHWDHKHDKESDRNSNSNETKVS